MNLPAVAMISPTRNRQENHANLYASFARQRGVAAHLYVMDESPAPSPFFSQIQDARVTYVHEPNLPRPQKGVSYVGRARNALIALVQEPITLSADDDDEYLESHCAALAGRLVSTRSHVVRLGCWLLSDGDALYLWDQRKQSGFVYAVRGGEKTQRISIPEPDPIGQATAEGGYGWSFCYWTDVARANPFPESGVEDWPWIRDLRAKGYTVTSVYDEPTTAIHRVHPGSSSIYAPGVKLAATPSRGFGALPGATELPEGKDVQVVPGATYEIVAAVKNENSLADITSRCANWGVSVIEAHDNVNATDFGVQPAESDYRLVHVIGKATAPGTLPWSTRMPISMFNKSHVMRAWVSKPAAAGVGAFQLNPQLL